MIQEVIQAVRDTPAKFLTRCTAVSREGTVCAIGAYAYQKLPAFRELVDARRANPTREYVYSLENTEEEDTIQSAYTLVGDHANLIFNANDHAWRYNVSADENKSRILEALSAVAEFFPEQKDRILA